MRSIRELGLVILLVVVFLLGAANIGFGKIVHNPDNLSCAACHDPHVGVSGTVYNPTTPISQSCNDCHDPNPRAQVDAGCPDNEGAGGADGNKKPVRMVIGEKRETATDLSFRGVGFNLRFTRTYRSRRTTNGRMGYNWYNNHGFRIKEQVDASDNIDVMITYPDGYKRLFVYDSLGVWTQPLGIYSILTYDEIAAEYKLTTKGGTVYTFDKSGPILTAVDRFGNILTYIYEMDGDGIGESNIGGSKNAGFYSLSISGGVGTPHWPGLGGGAGSSNDVIARDFKLLRVEETNSKSEPAFPAGRYLAFTYFESGLKEGRIMTVTDHAGRTVSYDYNDAGDLLTVTLPPILIDNVLIAQVTTYTYSEGNGTVILNHNLLSITDGRGNTYKTVTYNNDDRVSTQTINGDIMRYNYVVPGDAPFATEATFIDRRGIRTKYIFEEDIAYEGRVNTIIRSEGVDNYTTNLTYVDGPGNNANELDVLQNPRGYTARYDHDVVGNTLGFRRRGSDLINGTEGDDNANDLIARADYNHDPNNILDASKFYLIKTSTDPLGNITRYFYDFDEADPLIGDLNSDSVTDGTAGLLVMVRRPQVDTNGDGVADAHPETSYQYNNRGQVTKVIDPLGNITVFEYYEAGDNWGYLHKAISYPAAGEELVSTFVYDQRGNPLEVTDPRGHTSILEFNALNNISKSTSSQISATQDFTYELSFLYDGNNNIVQLDQQNLDKTGAGVGDGYITTKFTYDVLNNITSSSREVEDGVYITSNHKYDKNENLELTTLPEGNKIKYEYDKRNLPIFIYQGYGTVDEAVTSIFYDDNANVIKSQDPQDRINADGKYKHFIYDVYDRLTEVQDEDGSGLAGNGNRSVFGYDKNSNMEIVQHYDAADSILAESSNEYDAINRLVKTHAKLWGEVEGVTVTYANAQDVSSSILYKLNSLVERTTDPKGHVMEYLYDEANRLKADITYEEWRGGINSLIGLQNTYTLDENGNPTLIVRAERDQVSTNTIIYTTGNEFDYLNRITQVIDPKSLITSFAYDSRSNTVEVTDAEGNTTRSQYDLLNRQTAQIEDYTNQSTYVRYDYDDNGNLETYISDNYQATNYMYDNLDRMTKKIYPDNGQRTWSYNANSLPTTMVDPNGNSSVFAWDYKSLLTSIDVTGSDPGDDYSSFTYDGLYRLATANNKDGGSSGTLLASSTNTYDSFSRMTREAQTVKTASAKNVDYQYDKNSNLTKMTYAGGKVVDYVYDEMERVTDIDMDAANIAAYDYQAYKERKRNLANSVTSTIAYGTGHEVTSITDIYDPSTTTITDFAYGYDDVYNRIYEDRIHDSAGDVYQYDDTYRLSKVRYNEASPSTYNWGSDSGSDKQDFNLDVVDNRTSMSRTGNSTVYYEVNNLNQYVEVDTTSGAQGDNRTYDSNGNLTLDENNYTYTWDYKNRLVVFTKPTDTRVSFEYDSGGRRTYKLVETWSVGMGDWGFTSELYFYYAGVQVIEEYDTTTTAADTLQRTYTLSAQLDHPITITEEDEVGDPSYYYHYNSIGSVYALTDTSGSLVELYNYDAYGKLTITTDDANIQNPYFFTGRRFDSETDLYFYRARYYDPVTGTFLSRDPLSYVDSSSLYAYCADNPVNCVDPFGLRTANRRDKKGIAALKKAKADAWDKFRGGDDLEAARAYDKARQDLEEYQSAVERANECEKIVMNADGHYVTHTEDVIASSGGRPLTDPEIALICKIGKLDGELGDAWAVPNTIGNSDHRSAVIRRIQGEIGDAVKELILLTGNINYGIEQLVGLYAHTDPAIRAEAVRIVIGFFNAGPFVTSQMTGKNRNDAGCIELARTIGLWWGSLVPPPKYFQLSPIRDQHLRFVCHTANFVYRIDQEWIDAVQLDAGLVFDTWTPGGGFFRVVKRSGWFTGLVSYMFERYSDTDINSSD